MRGFSRKVEGAIRKGLGRLRRREGDIGKSLLGVAKRMEGLESERKYSENA